VTTNNVMVSQLAGRIAAAENLMTDHVAKLEERVHVLETTLEQELRNPGAVAGAIDQLRMLKDELAGMRQLMDEHPLQIAQQLQILEKKTSCGDGRVKTSFRSSEPRCKQWLQQSARRWHDGWRRHTREPWKQPPPRRIA